MIIRKGTEEDIPFIAGLWLKMVKELAPDFKPNVQWWIQMAFNMLKMGIYHFFVAETTPFCLVGFLDFFIYPEPSTGQIHVVGQHFYVGPGYRNGTASKGLYSASLRFVKASPAASMELFTFPEQQPFWVKKGFTPVRTLLRREVKHV